MALTLGTNCGFVTAHPSGDPGATAYNLDNMAQAMKLVAPANGTVTHIGFWQDHSPEAGNYEVDLYTHDAANDRPENQIAASGASTHTNATMWVSCAVNIPITSGATYWIAVQYDNTVTSCWCDRTEGTGIRTFYKNAATQLPASPWGATTAAEDQTVAFYALYTPTASFDSNTSLNIGDTWKTVASGSINIGDVWKTVTAVKMNVGDTWKTIY